MLNSKLIQNRLHKTDIIMYYDELLLSFRCLKKKSDLLIFFSFFDSDCRLILFYLLLQ